MTSAEVAACRLAWERLQEDWPWVVGPDARRVACEMFHAGRRYADAQRERDARARDMEGL